MPHNLSRPTLILLIFFFLFASVYADDYKLEKPKVALTGVEFDVSAAGEFSAGKVYTLRVGQSLFTPGKVTEEKLLFENITIENSGDPIITLQESGRNIAETSLPVIPAWISVIPPFIAILLAFLTRAVIPALFAAIWFGAWAANGMTFIGIFTGLLDSVQVYVLNTIIDKDHASIALFTFMLGGMVGIISRNGGMHGVVTYAIQKANNRRKGQMSVWALGLFIFFDDYANTLIVGNTSRMLCDKLKISREKLAYLVDSTAAPVSTVAVITTWIGFQVGLIADAIKNLPGLTESAYLLFLNSIPYSFYPLLAIFFVGLIAFSQKDFGPMLKAEKNALQRSENEGDKLESQMEDPDLQVKKNIPFRIINALLPILVLVFTVIITIYMTGEGERLQDILGSADSYKALIYGTLLSMLTAAILSVSQRILSLNEVFSAWYGGLKFMMMGMVVLVLAWALADISVALHTADYIVGLLGEHMPMLLLPAIVFLIAAITAFGSGSSWGVMAILMPLVIPLTWAVLENNGGASAENMHILYSTIACVLCGAVWADHCSPISDTTILTAMSTGCDLMDHVRTQMPYAAAAGAVALFIGTIPAAFGVSPWILIAVGAAVLFGVLSVLGKTPGTT